MVKTLILSLLLLVSLGFARGAAAEPPRKLRLSQKDVAELALKQGHATAEINLQFLQTRFAPIQALAAYDWKLDLQSGYEWDQSQTFSPATIPGASYKRSRTILGIQKPFTSGTLLGVDYNRLSQSADYSLNASTAGFPTTSLLPQQTQDIFDVTLEQSLFANFFGRADRATVAAADLAFQAAQISRTDSLQSAVLTALRAFWDGYTAQETFKEALASRDRYKSLVGQIKRKSGVGYANPGELSQAQAELEGQEQNVKSTSIAFLERLDTLATLLNLPPETQIEFVTDSEIPAVPKMSGVKVGDLRAIRAQQLLLQSADAKLVASRSKGYPFVNLVGRYYTSGYDQTADGSLSAMSGGTHAKYYVGAHLVYNFGSDLQNEDIINKKVSKELAERQLLRQKSEQSDSLAQAERKVQASYAIVQSALRQKDFRDKAVKDLTRTYTQGRTDIKLLIDAINNQFMTEVGLSRAIGDYQIALNTWAAARDELIPENSEATKENR